MSSGRIDSNATRRSAQSFQLPMDTPRPSSFIMSVTDSRDRDQSSNNVALTSRRVSEDTGCDTNDCNTWSIFLSTVSMFSWESNVPCMNHK